MLESITHQDYSSMWQALSEAAREAVEEEHLPEGRVLWCLADACSMMLQPGSMNEPFAAIVVTSSARTALPGDFAPEEIELFSVIYREPTNVLLRARLADLVWLLRVPRDHVAAITAIEAYQAVSISVDSWVRDGRACWERAIQLCLHLGSGAGHRLAQIERFLLDAFLEASYEDGPLALWIADVMRAYGLATGECSSICTHLDEAARRHQSRGDVQSARACFEHAQQWYTQDDNVGRAAEMAKLAAETYVKEAQAQETDGGPTSSLTAVSLIEAAIQRYRTIPKAHRAALKVDQRIDELRAQLAEAGERSLGEMAIVSSETFDISRWVQAARVSVRGQDPLSALLSVANVEQLPRVQRIRKQSKEMMRRHPIQTLFSATHIAADGRVVAKRPGAVPGEPGSDKALWAEMIKNYLIEVGLVVQGRVWPALQEARLEHRFREGDFVALVRQSPLVPVDRQELVARALFAGYDNDFVTALHVLVPQLEHFVRFHLKQAGVTTTHLDQDGIEHEVGLSGLMEKEEVEAILGEDLAFAIRGLFCDPFGPNLRNELAHGLVDLEEARSSPYSVYAWWLLFRLVVNSYWNVRRRSSDRADQS